MKKSNILALLTSLACSSSAFASAEFNDPEVTRLQRSGGHYIHCTDGSAAGAEFILAETDRDYTLIVKENAFASQTLGTLLSQSIDPTFQFEGSYLQFEAHIPFNLCRFSDTSSDIALCDVGTLSARPTLSDGLQSKTLEESQIYLNTMYVWTQSLGVRTRDFGFRMLVSNASHPFPHAFLAETSFDPSVCESH